MLFRSYNDTGFTVGQTERGVPGLAGLLAEDRAKESFFCGKVGLSLRSDLTYKDIAGMNLGTLLNDTVCVKVAESILAHVLDLTGDLLGTELGVSCFVCINFDMMRSVNVISYEIFVKKDRVLVVITFPGHKSDKSILTECDLTLGGSGTVCDNLSLLYSLAVYDDGALVAAGTLVGTLELDKIVRILATFIRADDVLCVLILLNNTRILCENNNAGVTRYLIFHTGTDNG